MRATTRPLSFRRLLTRLRYTKLALLVFGLGLVAGFIVVVGEYPEWERTAALVMALGLAALPVALFADGNGPAALSWIAARLRRGKAKGRRAPTRRKPPAKRQRAAVKRGTAKR